MDEESRTLRLLAGAMRQPRPPEEMDGTPSAIRRPAPVLGQHTDEVLAEFGLDETEIARLRESGGLGTSG